MKNVRTLTTFLILMTSVACGDGDNAAGDGGSGASGGSGGDGGNETETYVLCRYANPFSQAEECRGYLGDGWTATSTAEDCSSPFTGVVGELSEGTCDAEGAIGTCTEDPEGDLLLVTWFYGGDPDSTQAACEGFAGGVWSPGGEGPGGGLPSDGEVMQEAVEAMASNAEVTVTPPDCADGSCLDELIDDAGAMVFTPTAGSPETGFILYPGAGVDPRAYAPAAQAIARRGYLVALVPMKDMLAFNGVERADDVIAASPDVTSWFLGGHSLGGVSAVRYVSRKGPALPIDGLVLWASFPSEEDDISAAELPATSVFGSEDLLTTVEEIEDGKDRLPEDTRYVEVPGGNHAQFGYYGEQDGDGDALIDRESQQDMVVASTLHFFGSVASGPVTTHPGFAAAEALGADWCKEAQRIVANIESSELPDSLIENETLQEPRAFGESKASVDAAATPPLSIRSQLRYGGNSDLLSGPPVYVTELWCKLKNQEAILAELELTTSGEPQSCAEVNEAALDWALDQLSEAERLAYEASARSVSFAPDDAQVSGVAWLTESELSLSEDDGLLEVQSASLPVPLDADASEEFIGVHYCKLWSPADALRFVLE